MSFFIVLVLGVITGFLSSNVASDKGHDGLTWFLAGLFFGPLGLITAAGLSDRKLRKYIRQIGENQDAIKPEVLSRTSQELRKGNIIGTFQLVRTSEADAIWEKVLSMIDSDIANKADRSKSYLNEPLIGGTEFVINDSNGETLAYASRKEYSMATRKYQWEVSLG